MGRSSGNRERRPALLYGALIVDDEVAELQQHGFALRRAQENIVVRLQRYRPRSGQQFLIARASIERVVFEAGRRLGLRQPVAAVDEEGSGGVGIQEREQGPEP